MHACNSQDLGESGFLHSYLSMIIDIIHVHIWYDPLHVHVYIYMYMYVYMLDAKSREKRDLEN